MLIRTYMLSHALTCSHMQTFLCFIQISQMIQPLGRCLLQHELSTILFISYIINCLFYLHIVYHISIIYCFRQDLIYIRPSSFLVQAEHTETDFKARLDFKSGRCNQYRLATILLGTGCLYKGLDALSCFLFLFFLSSLDLTHFTLQILDTH